MASTGATPAIETIQEMQEEEREELRPRDEDADSENDTTLRQQRVNGIMVSTPKANTSKEREKDRYREREKSRSRRHRKYTLSGSGQHLSKPKTKNTSVKRASVSIIQTKDRDNSPERSGYRQRRPHPNRVRGVSSSSSSSSEGGDHVSDHRVILSVARTPLKSPSTISGLTSMTTTTNKSSSSSGSNSTVTQASLTRRYQVRRTDQPEGPLSPAVPDPPNVFAYLQPDDSVLSLREESEEVELKPSPKWSTDQLESLRAEAALRARMAQSHVSSSSSVSSGFQGDDNSSDAPRDVDTDRSTSPERSVGDQAEENEEDEAHQDAGQNEEEQHVAAPALPQDDTSVKIASQMAAAHQRQNLYHMHQFGTSDMQRGQANLPQIPTAAMNPRHLQHPTMHPLLGAEKLPATGYELLASQLSSRRVSNPEKGDKIKPIYRKFEALNHRVLLHLQDELSELEEQLQRLDIADTQSRRTENDIIPASRRAAAAAGGELQWLKTDTLGKIGYKLAQYNQALASFNSTRSLGVPQPEDVSLYRLYLQTANPIAELETHFLDPEDDLVSIYSDHITPSTSSYPSTQQSFLSSYAPSAVTPEPKAVEDLVDVSKESAGSPVQALAAGIAVSVLVPILAFSVIPNFIGRMTVACVVIGGVLVALMQGGVVDQSMLLRREGLMCAGIYGVVVAIVAGIL